LNIFIIDYKTKEDAIIFSHEFNKNINEGLLLNFKKVIFSNHELTNDLFDYYADSNYKNF